MSEPNLSWTKDAMLKDLLTKLLNKDPNMRLKSADSVKKHPWFKIFKWEDLLNRKMKPFFVPNDLLRSKYIAARNAKY